MQNSNDDVVAAKTVLIIGGGAVGVELAGQLHPPCVHNAVYPKLCMSTSCIITVISV